MVINKFEIVELTFYKNIQKYLGDFLYLYCVTGSLARKETIEGWSDIDIVLVFEQLNEDIFLKLKKCIDLNLSDIKIGVTFYGLLEFNSYKFQDPKTHNVIRNVFTGKYEPRFIKNNVIIANQPIVSLQTVNGVEFNKDLHILKRELLTFPKWNERKLYKSLTYLLRAYLLIKKGIFTDGYSASWKTFYDEEKLNSLEIILPKNIINNVPNLLERRAVYYKLLKILT